MLDPAASAPPLHQKAAQATKRCSRCQRSLGLEAFSRDRSRADGLNHFCRGCDSAKWSERYQTTGAAYRTKRQVSARACQQCGQPATSSKHWFCDACRDAGARRRIRRRDAALGPGKTTKRGYGNAHQKARKAYAHVVAAGDCHCSRCGGLIVPGSPWDLDHTDDRTGYLGPAHRSCNRRAAAIKRNKRALPERSWSRAW